MNYVVLNIVTLAVCVGMIMIFRQSDKNNRSIEKAKRYGERIKEDLETFINEKQAGLSEVATELGVQQTRAIAAVKKLDEIYSQFMNNAGILEDRSAAIQEIDQYIVKSDQTIQKLMDMTSLAEKNLTQITREADFVESLAKSINAAKAELNEVTASIPEMHSRFAQEADNKLEAYKAKILEEMRLVIEDVENRLSSAQKSTNDLLDDASVKLQDIYKKAYSDAADKAGALQEAAFTKLKDQTAEKVENYRKEFEAMSVKIEEQINKNLGETKTLAEDFKTEWQTQAKYYLDEMETRFSESENNISQKMDEIEERVKEMETTQDNVFENLKDQASEKVQNYRKELEEASTQIEERISRNLRETRSLAEDFKTEWQTKANQYLDEMHTRFSESESGIARKMTEIISRLSEIEDSVSLRSDSISADLSQTESTLRSQFNSIASNFQENMNSFAKFTDKKLNDFRLQTEVRFNKFEETIANVDLIKEEIEKSQNSAKENAMRDLSSYAESVKQDQRDFLAEFEERSETVREKMKEIEAAIEELKAKSYTNVSEKLQSFEDSLFADLAKRNDAINTDFEQWKSDISANMALLASENESARKDIEFQYKHDLRVRISQIAEEYKVHFSKLDEKVSEIENNLSSRLTAADDNIQGYTDRFREYVSELQEKTTQSVENEFIAYKAQLQDTVNQQNEGIEEGSREIQEKLNVIREDADEKFEMIKKDFETWKVRTDQQFTDARSLFDDKITSLAGLTENAIKNLNTRYSAQYKDFVAKTDEAFGTLQAKINSFGSKVTAADNELKVHADNAVLQFKAEMEKVEEALDKKIKDADSNAESSVQKINEMIHAVRLELSEAQDKVRENIQAEAGRLNSVLEEIDRKQNDFIAQTKVFERADELKSGLEKDIEEIKSEITRFEVHRKAIDDLTLQYDKVTHLEDEANQKIARFMNERKNIEFLEAEFVKLTALSDSMEKKVIELTAVNDDLQQYQVQIRRIEEGIGDVNTRYERLEKKGSVLDQTLESIDSAFENLKTLEADIKNFKDEITTFPSEIEKIKLTVDSLLINKDRADSICEKIESIDSMAAELNAKIDNLKSAREWLAATETRLQEISKESQAQLKLMSDLFKSELPERNENGGPSVSVQENVLKLSRQGWKSAEIAKALNLSLGEVDLILEYSDKI